MSYLGVSLNESKTVNVSKKNRRTLVGLNLSNNGRASVGRDEKRRLRASLHSLCNGRLPAEDVPRLRGMLAFVYSVDPEFVMALCIKHGFSSINEIGNQ
jgi:hypothetical protein